MLFGRRRIEKRHNFPRMRSKTDRRRSRQQVLGGSRSYSLRISRHDTTRIAIWTLYLRTLCIRTIVPDLVLELGSAGWVTGSLLGIPRAPSLHGPPPTGAVAVILDGGISPNYSHHVAIARRANMLSGSDGPSMR